MVMSDHGFHSFRREVNLNTWLVQNGYMVLHGQEHREERSQDLFGRGRFWEGVDWSKTRAYAVGLGQIYFNLRGPRVRRASSPREQEYRALQDEIGAKLVQLTDPETGERVFRASTGATTSTRASTSRTRPTCRWASTTATAWAGRTRSAASAGRWSRTTTRSGAATTARPPPRSATASSSATARSRTPRRTSWTSPPRS